MDELQPHKCPLCIDSTGTGKVVTITEKGAEGIERAAIARCVSIDVRAGTAVHEDCRLVFTNKKAIESALKKASTSASVSIASISTRKRQNSASTSTDNKSDCFYCGDTVSPASLGCTSSSVKTDIFVNRVTEICHSRDDEWSAAVRGQLEFYRFDLHAADVLYHHDCDICFRTGRQAPVRVEPLTKKLKSSGRPIASDQNQAFVRVCDLVVQKRHASITELRDKMSEYLEESGSQATAYSKIWLKKKLREHFGDEILISQEDGNEDIVSCVETVEQIVRQFLEDCDRNADDTKAQSLIKAAAKVISVEISKTPFVEMDHYPSMDDMTTEAVNSTLPPLLKVLLESIMTATGGSDDRHKVAFIGQAIMQSAKPRTMIAPWNFLLGVSLYHVYRSRYLIDVLYFFGLSCSYNEILRFVRNSAAQGAECPLGELAEGMTVLFSCDNVDHNIVTLDGKGTFHGLGLMASITPGGLAGGRIARKKPEEIRLELAAAQIDIKQFSFGNRIRSAIQFAPLPDFDNSVHKGLDIMWELSTQFQIATPSWNGMMCSLTSGGDHPGKSSFRMLPMIDMPSTDYTCLYSALRFIDDLAYRHKIHPVVTLDQPLYWKTNEILNSLEDNDAMKRIVLMLGPFHTLMNYVGAVGCLMSGLGIEEMFQEIYADNVINHLISGKAVSRAFRAHVLLERAVTSLIIEPLLDQPEFASEVQKLEELYVKRIAGQLPVDDLTIKNSLLKMEEKIAALKDDFAARCRNNQMLVHYSNMIQNARDLVRAERSGNWQLHLNTTRKILPVLAAAGHFNYVKSGYLYIQNMTQLEVKHPAVYDMLNKGLFVCRRSEKFWCGMSSDLSIEQVLMRSLKSRGGLTRGSGMDENQRLLWTLSAPTMSAVNNALSEIVEKTVTRNEQHKEMAPRRQERDWRDLQILREKLRSHGPIHHDCAGTCPLSNFVTGTVAPPDVNVDEFDEIGSAILKKMESVAVFNCKLSRKDRATNMIAATRSIKLADGRTVDSALIFQRLVIAAQTGDISLQDSLEYELSPYPPALFESAGMLLKADKPALAKAIRKHAQVEDTNDSTATPPITDHYVMDGGSLLYKMKWQTNSTYLTIASAYAKMVTKRYFRPNVIFDGYKKPSIKDMTHARRNLRPGPKVSAMDKSEFRGRREIVLSNTDNKDQLIKMIIPCLHTANCKASQSVDDADLDLVLTATTSAKNKSTTLLGEDTDLLILALYHYDTDSETLLYRSEKKTATTTYDIKGLSLSLGENLRSLLLFVHAYSGCDSTSRVARLSKQNAFQSVVKNPRLRSIAAEFSTPGHCQDRITQLGIDAMRMFFGAVSQESLASMRQRILSNKIMKASTYVTPDRIPPTESATKFHSLRVYYQVMAWMNETGNMEPEEWGWKIVDGCYVPIPMDIEPAPPQLLDIVHCDCKTGCETNRCSCRKYGFPCHSGCGTCQIEFCANCTRPDRIEDDSADENDS